jgi:hypothetical protein
MDERSRLRALLQACHRVIAQLERLRPDDDNPFPKRIRETCRALETRMKKLERRADAARATFGRDTE